MFAPANQTHFALTLEGLPSDLQVLSLQGQEAISQPFVFEVELASEKPPLDLETLLHKPAFLQLSADGSGIHGFLGVQALHEHPDLDALLETPSARTSPQHIANIAKERAQSLQRSAV
jgi:uncharacterized protein involved in type VI secretion and phage assembly